ncbi:MarR family transcriptional regulator [Oscillibacter sp.]|uniref:metal-dependent transcriptional regulator n=1 Tax=Oscillibacter sp. TaxID=1945593 RepID=UPI002896E9A7|nr:MarR family transcriptional regulator [Oscillibacter sp.]
MERLTPAHRRYLAAIYDLSHAMPDVSTVELAKALHVTKPSVTRMSAVLMDKGFLVRKRYGKIYLTDTGFLAARDFKRKALQLQSLLPRLGLDLTEGESFELSCLLAASLPERALEGLGA